MKCHITNIYGFGGVSSHAQNSIAEIARSIDFIEMGIFGYAVHTDSDSELQRRIDGIIASVQRGDIIVFQSPSWNGKRFDYNLINTIKAYGGRVALLVHDVPAILNPYTRYTLQECVEIYNLADLLILPSERMRDRLIEEGLTVTNVMYQQMFDYPLAVIYESQEFKKKITFTGPPTRFPFVYDWTGKTEIELYALERDIQRELPKNVKHRDYCADSKLVYEMSQGGFGFVWSEGEEFEYSRMNLPYKFNTYMAAGIPVFVKRGMNIENFVAKNGVGYIVDSCEEADEIIQNMNEETYRGLIDNVRRIQYMVTNGMFTKKLLFDVVDRMNNKVNE